MKPLALSLLLLAACQGGGSNGVTVIEEPPPEPSPIGSWGGSYMRGDESWPLAGTVSEDSPGLAIGLLNLPQTIQRQWGFTGEMSREIVAGRVVSDEVTLDLWAELQPESEDTWRERGFLYVGFFVTRFDDEPVSGSVAFRVIPPGEDE